MSWRRSRPGDGAVPTVGGNVSGVFNTGAGATINVGMQTWPGRVVTHEEMLLGLRGRRTSLLEEELRFVGPGPDHEADPQNLLTRLSGPDPRGVLVVGPAGAGKTRTCFEVAVAAHAEGQRVLHVLASPVVTVEDLDEVLSDSDDRRVLLVFDYLDACPQLDLRALADRFLAHAKRSGIDVACVASARPGSVRALQQRGVSLLFDQVTLRDDQLYRSEVTDHIVHAIAPAAVRHWGEMVMTEACGRRPIIALLIARAIEQRLADGHPASEGVMLHSAELRPWLQDALRHDGLTATAAPGPGPLDTSVPTTQELACAVAVAACPQPREAVEGAVEAFLTSSGPSPYSGRQAVDVLLSLGWLDEAAGRLVLVHDIVADELLMQSLLPSPGYSVHRPSAEALCATVSRQGGSFALFTDHLRRMMADLSAQAPQHKADALEHFCGEWVVRHRGQLGAMLATAGEDGEQALLTMVLNRPWRSVVRECWAEVGRPWLVRAESALVATRFLAATLRSEEVPEVIVVEALSWLSRRFGQTDADHVIRALLNRPGLSREQNRLVLDHAITWIRDHPRWAAAPEVLCRLLKCEATSSDRLEAARCALEWFTPRRSPDACAVLRNLLECDGLPDEIRDSAVDKAMAWASANDKDAAPFLATLLQSDALIEQQQRTARKAGLLWLQRNPSGPNQSFLIHTLLAGKDVQECLDILWPHVSGLPGGEADPIVIHRMLESDSINTEQARVILDQAFAWLVNARDPYKRRLVITSMMGRDELAAADAARLAVEAKALLEEAPTPKYLTALLLRGNVIDGEQARRAITCALSWCRSSQGIKQKRQLINALLQRSDLPQAEAREVIAMALARLETDHSAKAANCLNSLLQRNDLTPAELDRTLAHAVLRLEANDSSLRRDFLSLLNLLRRPDLPPEAAATCNRHAQAWLTTAPPTDPRVEQLRAHFPYRGAG